MSPALDGSPILATARLILRTYRSDDLPLFAAMNADARVIRYLGGNALSRAQSDAIAAGAQEGFAAAGVGKIAIERKADGAFLGMCGLSRERWYPADLELGWRLAPDYWGNGYASEAACAWLEYAFTTLAAARVISISDRPNEKSIAVMTRIGMRFDHEAELVADGEAFSAVVYALSAADWRANPA